MEPEHEFGLECKFEYSPWATKNVSVVGGIVMAEGIVESKEEMKKKMEKKKKGESEEKGKMQEMKEGASEKKEEIKQKAGEVKEEVSGKKEDISENIEEMKEGASEKTEEVKRKAGEVKEEVVEQKEELEKESEAEGRNPAEKLLSDLISGFRQRTGEINEAVSPSTSESKTPEKPLIDVMETNDTIMVMIDLPGVKRDDIDIGISKNSVEITANFKEEPEMEGGKFVQKERSYGEIHRSIALSTEIKVKEATANLEDCTLTVTLPKTEKDITKVKIGE